MRVTVHISDDSLALACGADRVAEAFCAAGCAVERFSSWGMHWLEVLVVIAGEGFGPVTPEDVPAILTGTSKLGIGRVADLPWIARQQRLIFARAGQTRPLSLADYEASGGWEGLQRARTMPATSVIDAMTRSGLRGRGGAGFPAGIKWQTVAGAPLGAGVPRRYIVCNADEGDSGSFADRALMENDPFQLIEGMAIAALGVGSSYGFIYIRSEYPHAITRMRVALELAAPIIAPFVIEVRVGAGAYVCGEETALLNSLEGKRGEVRAKPPLPAISGLFGCPTLVHNVLTLAAATSILRAGGADAYAALGMDRSRGTMPIQLGGNILRGGLYEVPFGISLHELLYEIGGGTRSGRPVKAVQVGGPLGAYIPPDRFDLPFDYEAYARHDALIGHGGVVVFDDTADMPALARLAMRFCADESCGKCTPCRIGSVRAVEILDRLGGGLRESDPLSSLPQMRNHKSTPPTHEDDIALIVDLCDTMKSASLCALGGLAPFPVLSAMQHWPEEFAR